MSTERNLDWGRKQLAKLLRFNVNQADEVYDGVAGDPWQTMDDLLNEAQRVIVNETRTFINPDCFGVVHQVNWPASQATYQLPATIHATSILHIEDITDGNPGYMLSVDPSRCSGLWFKDYNTLQWGETGPSEDRTLYIKALATPNVMWNPTDEPLLIPYDHRDLWIWEAACLGRDFADDEIPASWIDRRDRYKDTLQIAVAQGAPWGPGKPAIMDADSYFLVL